MNYTFNKYIIQILLLFIIINSQTISQVRFAAIGDYGLAGDNELAVANLVKSWNPDFIITLGDNNYPLGADSTIDQNIGQYYHEYIYPYEGTYGNGSNVNRFFPSLGNHDWYSDSAKPYLDYFELPGNERYYDFIYGNIHLFSLDSDPNEPDGVTDTSFQAMWLKNALQSSEQKWNIVYIHHAPYSSGPHTSTIFTQWPYKLWGADLVLSGHDHDYERLIVDSLTYIVNGLGGHSIYTFVETLEQSVFRFCDNYGALLIEADENKLTTKFYNINEELIDSANVVDRVRNYSIVDYLLNQNYPNPFNSSTSITYEIPVGANVSIVLYDILGRKVDTLIDDYKYAGVHSTLYIVNYTLPSGIYFYTLRAGHFIQTKKMILIK